MASSQPSPSDARCLIEGPTNLCGLAVGHDGWHEAQVGAGSSSWFQPFPRWDGRLNRWVKPGEPDVDDAREAVMRELLAHARLSDPCVPLSVAENLATLLDGGLGARRLLNDTSPEGRSALCEWLDVAEQALAEFRAAHPREETSQDVHELKWTDIDGDRIRFSWDDHEQVGLSRHGHRGCVQIFDGENSNESAVLIDEEDARRMIAWLTARLAKETT